MRLDKERAILLSANPLQVSSIAHFVIARDHSILEWNRACEVLTGYPASSMIGTKDQWKPFYSDVRPCLADLILDGTGEKKVRGFYRGMLVKTRVLLDDAYEVEGFFRPLGDQGRWLRFTAAGIKGPTGDTEGVIETIEDITERKVAEQEMERLNKELIKSNKRLKQLALLDPQTGLFNHRYLEEVIEAEVTRSRRYEQALSLIMIDLDYFKSVNDVYGHQFGDLVLQQLAVELKKQVRRYDIVIRFGGEEFVIISPGIDRFQTMILAQRILDELTIHGFGDKEHEIKVKMSMAVISFPEEKIAKGMDLVNLADLIIDKAKEDGGNRVYSSFDVKKKLKLKRAGGKQKPENVFALQHKLGKVTRQANQSLVESIFAFAKTIELKDHYTGEHVERTVHYATQIARMLNFPQQKVEAVRQAAVLHDLGKIGISDEILLKNCKLSPQEYEEIKKHPQIAADILRPIKFLHSVIPLILYHHERWDGKGYPTGLSGDMIPMGARIISVADVYQALTSNRPYRKAFSKEDAIKILKDGAGSQFDPRIVKVFLKMLKGKK